MMPPPHGEVELEASGDEGSEFSEAKRVLPAQVFCHCVANHNLVQRGVLEKVGHSCSG